MLTVQEGMDALTLPLSDSYELDTAIYRLRTAIYRMDMATTFASRIPLYRDVIAELLSNSAVLLQSCPSLRDIASQKVIEIRTTIAQYRSSEGALKGLFDQATSMITDDRKRILDTLDDLIVEHRELEKDLQDLERVVDELDAVLIMGDTF
jgi:transcriptional regulator with AAA-type ATPase domain